MSKKTPSYTYRFTVASDAADFNGHVDNVTYLRWFVDAAMRHSDAAGWGMEACRKHGGSWVARSHRIEYLRPAFAGEELTMETRLIEIGRFKALREYELYRDETPIARAATEWIYVDTKTMRPKPIPPELVDAFTTFQTFQNREDTGRED